MSQNLRNLLSLAYAAGLRASSALAAGMTVPEPWDPELQSGTMRVTYPDVSSVITSIPDNGMLVAKMRGDLKVEWRPRGSLPRVWAIFLNAGLQAYALNQDGFHEEADTMTTFFEAFADTEEKEADHAA